MAITLPFQRDISMGLTEYSGSFSHTVGAAEETFNLGGGGRVESCEIQNMDSGAKLQLVRVSESVSGGTNTVTVHALDAVTDGRITVRVRR